MEFHPHDGNLLAFVSNAVAQKALLIEMLRDLPGKIEEKEK